MTSTYIKSNGFTFQCDLLRANTIETALLNFIIRDQQGCTAETSQDKLSFKDWDIKVTYPDSSITTLEIKEDRNVAVTGNIAVELGKESGGIETPSGLSSTKADFYVYYFNKAYHFIETAVFENTSRI